jgi:hypothetical protein
MSATARTVVARLTEKGIPFETLPVGVGATIIVSSYGARVYGPFFGDGPSRNWMPDAFADAASFSALLESGFWNVGGERIWIGPEIAFMIPDRSDYWGSYSMPPSMDPGVHTISRAGDTVLLRRSMTLESFVEPRGTTVVDVEIRIRAAAHPLRHLRGAHAPALAPRVAFAGYSSEVTLRHTAPLPIAAESWNLNQIHAGGVALVSTAPEPQVTDYYEPVGSLMAPAAGGMAVRITGADRFKIGFAAPHALGRVGYFTPVADGIATLLVRNSLSDPSAEYSEEPDFAPAERGDPLHIYNDDGGLGGFAELEARGRPVEASPPTHNAPDAGSPAGSVDTVTSWWFTGDVEPVSTLARSLTGIDPATIDLSRPANRGARQ